MKILEQIILRKSQRESSNAIVGSSSEINLNPDKITYKINHSYLLYFSIVFTVAGNLQGGWVLAENAQAGFILDKQLEWEAEGSKAYINMITIVTIIFIMIKILRNNINNDSTNNNNIFGNCQVLDKTIRKLVSTYTTKNWFKGCLQQRRLMKISYRDPQNLHKNSFTMDKCIF